MGLAYHLLYLYKFFQCNSELSHYNVGEFYLKTKNKHQHLIINKNSYSICLQKDKPHIQQPLTFAV